MAARRNPARDHRSEIASHLGGSSRFDERADIELSTTRRSQDGQHEQNREETRWGPGGDGLMPSRPPTSGADVASESSLPGKQRSGEAPMRSTRAVGEATTALGSTASEPLAADPLRDLMACAARPTDQPRSNPTTRPGAIAGRYRRPRARSRRSDPRQRSRGDPVYPPGWRACPPERSWHRTLPSSTMMGRPLPSGSVKEVE